MYKLALTLTGVVFIAGCGASPPTKDEICYSITYGELNSVQSSMREIETALANGYRTVRSTQPTTRVGRCMTNVPGSRPISYRCQKNSTMTVETPVSIDYAEERKKLSALKRRYNELNNQLDTKYAACLRKP